MTLDHLHVVMYTRKGCHLCDQAWELLRGQRERHGFQLQALDVDSNPEWVGEFGECVPVVTVNGKVRFRGKINQHLVSRLFEVESRLAARLRRAR